MTSAVDTILVHATNPGTAWTAGTVASGDSLTVRSFNPPDWAQIKQVVRAGGTSGGVRVRSPLLYDNVEGLQFYSKETPTVLLLPPELGQPVQASDTLVCELTGGTAESDIAALSVYYSNLPGASTRLHSWGDISGLLGNMKGLEVAVTASGTVGDWADYVSTTTEDLLQAGRDHAILGYVTDAALGYVAVKGQETNNLRIGGPGSTSTDFTSNWFVDRSKESGVPYIPVFNANNKNNLYVSVADDAASTAAKVTLILVELTQNLSS